MSETFTVEVVLALPGRSWRREVTIGAGTTAQQAVSASGLDALCRQHTGETPLVGVYGRKVAAEHVVQAGERLELYRALTADPRQRRRAEVAERRERLRLAKAAPDSGTR